MGGPRGPRPPAAPPPSGPVHVQACVCVLVCTSFIWFPHAAQGCGQCSPCSPCSIGMQPMQPMQPLQHRDAASRLTTDAAGAAKGRAQQPGKLSC